MPKQKINHSTPAAVDETRFDLTVGWQRDCGVQVGIETVDNGDGQRHLVDYIYGSDETLESIGREVVRALGRNGGKSNAFDTVYAHQGHPNPTTDAAAQMVGRAVLDAVTGSTPFGTSVWWHPTRHMINALIRTLRKARDQAYGADA